MARLASLKSAPDLATAEGSPLPANCNFFRVLANSSAALNAYATCAESLAKGQLTPRQREFIAIMVAEINGSNYCLSAHYASARKLGLTHEEIRSARRAVSDDAQTQALLRFTQAVAIQRGEISEADFQYLRLAGFNDALIAEVISNIALNIFANYFNSVARTEVDFPLLKPGADKPERR